jgi:hypothetical protein
MVCPVLIEGKTMGKDSRLTKRQSFWLEHLRACADGSMSAYAEANGLNVHSLYGAKKRLKHQGPLAESAPRLVRVTRAALPPSPPTLFRVHLRNGTSVEVACAPQHWAELFSQVAALP